MIRLARFGARKQPYYRVVVIEKRQARNGRSLEIVGTYNPRTNPATVDLKRDRIEHWVASERSSPIESASCWQSIQPPRPSPPKITRRAAAGNGRFVPFHRTASTGFQLFLSPPQ